MSLRERAYESFTQHLLDRDLFAGFDWQQPPAGQRALGSLPSAECGVVAASATHTMAMYNRDNLTCCPIARCSISRSAADWPLTLRHVSLSALASLIAPQRVNVSFLVT